VSGTFLGPASTANGDVVDIDLSVGAVKPGVRDTKVASEIRRAFERWDEVQQDAAKLRHAAVLEAFGVTVPCRRVTVEDCSLVYAPTYVGWLRTATHDRVVAIDGVSGALSERMSAVLTSHISHVRSSLLDDAPA
jgi:hypothetical protein